MALRPESTPASSLPRGDPVENVLSVPLSSSKVYEGKYVALKPLDAEKDVDELYGNSHGNEDALRLWTYMFNGPFVNREDMLRWLRQCQASSDPLFLTVHGMRPAQRLGMVSFMNRVPEMRRLELGNIWYAPSAQRSKVNTESIYLMLREAFDQLQSRRVEWKCDALNERSRTAALRLGFSFEGVFRKHMVVKGRNRDTAWYALLDEDWPQVKKNMKKWLYTDEAHSLAELNRALVRADSS